MIAILAWMADGSAGYARGCRPSSSARIIRWGGRRELLGVAFAALALVPGLARADEPAGPVAESGVLPGAVVDFPTVEDDGHTDWAVTNRAGVVVCQLPCTLRLTPTDLASGYSIEGRRGDHSYAGRTRLALPESLSSNGRWIARVSPQKGNPDGALVLGIVSAVLLVSGGVVVGSLAMENNCVSACAVGTAPAEVLGGLSALVLGGVGGIAAIVWGVRSHRAKLAVEPPSGSGATSSPVSVRMAGPRGVVVSF
jgi:hypothetical protein